MEKAVFNLTDNNATNTKKQVLFVLKLILKTGLLLFVFTAFSFAKIQGVKPFASGLYFALIFLNVNFPVLSIVYAAAEVIASPDIFTFLYASITVAVGTLTLFILSKFKKRAQILKPIFLILSQAGLFFLYKGSVFAILASVLITVLFSYACFFGLKTVLADKLRYKLNAPELFFLSVMTVVLSLGLSHVNTKPFSLMLFFSAILILIASRVKNAGASVVIATCLGVGNAIFSYNIDILAALVFTAALSYVFVNAHRVIFGFAAAVAFVMFTFYFNVDLNLAAFNVLSFSCGAAVFLFIPKKAIDFLSQQLYPSSDRTAIRYMINRKRAETGNALYAFSDVFVTMADGASNQKELLSSYGGKLESRCCAFCENYTICKDAYLSTTLDRMLAITFSKGRMAVADIPPEIQEKCVHLGRLITTCTEIDELKQKEQIRYELEKDARFLAASLLGGSADAIKGLSKKEGSVLNFLNEKERIIIEELTYLSVPCSECVAVDGEVNLIVRNDFPDAALIEKTVSKLMRARYEICHRDSTVLSGHSCLTLKKLPLYDIVFGVTSGAKPGSEKSGDTHSFVKLSSNKMMIALSDGMGTGKEASRVSETAINLIESFYKADFSPELAVKTVNRFLSLYSGEIFSATDIAVINLETLTADIIKLGSPASYIKTREETKKIQGAALPLGAVDEVKPTAYSVNLSVGDFVIFISDGISDSFKADTLSALINDENSLNAKTMSETIFKTAQKNNKDSLSDDSTVIAARIIKREF